MKIKKDNINHIFRNKYLVGSSGNVISPISSFNDSSKVNEWFYEDENGDLHSKLTLISDKDILATGGITQFIQGDRTESTIMDGVVTDNVTITKENGILKVIGGESDFDISKMWTALSGSTDEQINKSHLTTALSGYATTEQLNSKWTTDNTKIAKWDEAYNLKHSHSNKSVLDSISSTKVSNWDTAFSWGNHSTFGYAHLANEETFTGLKHFTEGLSVGSDKKKIYEKDGVVYLDGDLAVTGGITQFASGNEDISTIMDGVVADEVTITKGTDNVLRIKNAGSGSNFDKSAMWAALSENTDEQINYSHISTVLSNYSKTTHTHSISNISNLQTTLDGKANLKHTHSKSDITDFPTTWNWNSISNKPTTLSGYGITNAYTKTESDNKYPTKTGSGASGTWGISISGNAATASKLQDRVNDSSSITLYSGKRSDNTSPRTLLDDGWKLLYNGAALANVNSNVASATKLKNTRTIWGQNFNGEQNVSGNMTGVGNITATGTLNSANLKVTDSVYVNGIRISKLKDGIVKIDGSLAVTGGITQYSVDNIDTATIMDGVVVDGTTIKKENGKLVAVGGGEAGSVNWNNITNKPSTFTPSTHTHSINNITNLQTVLDGKAPSSHTHNYASTVKVGSTSYNVNSNVISIPAYPTSLKNPNTLTISLNGTSQGAYDGSTAKSINITASSIGAAASSHNHSWSNITSGKPTTLSGYGITNAYTKTESDNKYPTKTGSGASGTWGINITGNAVSSSKSNTIAIDGMSNLNSPNWNEYAATIQRFDVNAGNRPPVGDNANAVLNIPMTKHGTSGMYGYQLAFVSNKEEIYARKWSSGNPTTWKRLPFVDYNTGYLRYGFSSVLSTDWFRSEGNTGWYSQTYGGGIYMTDSNYIRTLNNKAFCALRYDADQGSLGNSWNNGQGAFSVRIHNDGNQTPLLLAYRNATNDTGANRLFAMELLNNGNQLNFGMGGKSQLELQKGYLTMNGTIRASNDVYGNRLIYKDITSTNLSASDYFLSNQPAIKCEQDLAIVDNDRVRPILRWGDAVKNVGYNTRYVIGSVRSGYDWGRIFMSVSNNDAGTSAGCSMSIYGSGYVEVNGNVLATGGITQYSDIRAKNIIEDVNIDLQQIANSPAIRYTWNNLSNCSDSEIHVGGIAQYIKEILPEVIYCNKSNDNDIDLLSMDYATTSYIYSVNIAKYLVAAKNEINELKEQINLLKDTINNNLNTNIE